MYHNYCYSKNEYIATDAKWPMISWDSTHTPLTQVFVKGRGGTHKFFLFIDVLYDTISMESLCSALALHRV